MYTFNFVTPLAGVWIETTSGGLSQLFDVVTPLAGVWIETIMASGVWGLAPSHSPCGSVD